jgi:hypothetical protein
MENTPLWRVEDLMSKPAKTDWLVEGVLVAKSRALLHAESGVGKTYTALDISLHIATGQPWQGHAVKQGPVYYLAAENAELFAERVQAWEKQHKGLARWQRRNGEQAPFAVYHDPLDLSSPASVNALLAHLGTAQLVVVDTVLASLGAFDIKDTHNASQAMEVVKRIMSHTGATVLLVTHEPDKGVNPLGGSAWRANTQTRIRLTRHRGTRELGEDNHFEDGDTITLTCKKQSGAAQFPDIVVSVRLVKPPHGTQTVPVLASEKTKGRRQASSLSPRLRVVPTVDLWTLYEQNGQNAAKVADILGEPHDRVRKRIQRLQRNRAETDQLCADVPA